ncbi:retropepsin-like aspartic protease [Chryseobacterium tructae]|uniref:Retropepsin-like aspartic protease n=1 Tax=Chryseobacterium tructae TaxID=1037380 RepID=A0ABV7XXR9_9FLAO|nr:retropepsin-like aspartic protease [Chryseobacterium tructae]MDN3693524.1 retropepsin-like aspartic protease [Chryseobacterium tructae]
MKKVLYTLFIFSHLSLIAQGKKFFENGEVQLKSAVEKINLKYSTNLPFVKVHINGKVYNFLLDTGAPTVISNAVYTELGLEKKHKSSVKDSQKNKQTQIFTVLPEMVVDQLTFKDIGVIVMDLTATEFGCFKVDGILGSNQMAKLFWRLNYSENSLEGTQDLSKFDLTGYDIVIPFDVKDQKTPIIEARIMDKKMNLTFDTGFSGNLKITNHEYNSKKVTEKVDVYGNSSVGAFGTGNPVPGYIFKAYDVSFGNKIFNNEVVATGNSNLVGNSFLENFVFVLDWTGHKIYMKQIKETSHQLESFGFGYRFIDSKPIVAYIFQEENFPLKVGDSIISINNIDLDHLDKEGACHYFLNRVEKDAVDIDLKIRRDGAVMNVNLKKKMYLKG